MNHYLLDSNIIIEALRLYDLQAEKFLLEKYPGKIYLSQITIAELFSGHSAQDKNVAAYLKYLISELAVVKIDKEISILAGQLRYQYKISMPDAFIAASALQNNLQLITYNKKDFAKIKELKI